MRNSINILLLLIASQLTYSQEFKSRIWIEDTNGRKDSVEIGYDPNASEILDDIYGGIDISDSIWNDFEIRAAQIDVIKLSQDLRDPKYLQGLTRYQTKIEIIPKECLAPIPVSNQSGFVPFISLLIKTDVYPIKIKWNMVEFSNDCVSKSVISDWPITTWWDVPISGDLQINDTEFALKTEIEISRHSGLKIIDVNNDTLMMLNIVLADGLGSSTSNKFFDKLIDIKPNPSSGRFKLNIGAQLIKLFNANGQYIEFKQENDVITYNYEGIIYAIIKYENEIFTRKLIGYRR